MTNDTEPSPTYLCESFGATDPEQTATMQDWLNTHADRGYRLVDRQVSGSGGATKRIHVVMELQYDDSEEPAAEAEQGGE